MSENPEGSDGRVVARSVCGGVVLVAPIVRVAGVGTDVVRVGGGVCAPLRLALDAGESAGRGDVHPDLPLAIAGPRRGRHLLPPVVLVAPDVAPRVADGGREETLV